MVAKEINTGKRDDLFAATPPLEAKKALFSFAMTEGIGWRTGHKDAGMKLDFIDVRRAYLYAKARRDVYIVLPEEDSCPGMCGKLDKAMYGTRDAAQNWEHEYTEFLEEAGFTKGIASSCAFYHPEQRIRVVIHGDDFTVLGHAGALDWFRIKIAGRYEVKFRGRLGPDTEDDKAIRLLNRIIQWTDEGILYEADQRHAEIIIRELGLHNSVKTVMTPGTKVDEGPEDERELDGSQATMFRAMVARANYLAQDRTDIQYTTKELSRNMSKATWASCTALKRLGRYLKWKPRMVSEFPYQEGVTHVTTWTDTDYAGCRKTRKSTTAGVMMLGKHVLKGWSTTQAVVALSSGEAEYYGIVKGAAQSLGFQALLGDLGVKMKIRIKTDASAARGIAYRRGLGKIKHLEISQLWLQDRIYRKEFDVIKIHGKINRADALTKYVGREDLENHCRWLGLVSERGRHELMPEDAAKPGEDEGGIFHESEEEKEDADQDEAMASSSRSGGAQDAHINIEEVTWHRMSERRQEEVCREIDHQEDVAGALADNGNVGVVRFTLAENRGRVPKEQGLCKGFTHITRLEDNATLLDHCRVLAMRLNCKEKDIVMTCEQVAGKISSTATGDQCSGRILVPGSHGEHGVNQEVGFYLLSSSQLEDGGHDKDAITSEEEKEVMKELRKLPAWKESQRLTRNLRRFNRCQALHNGLALEAKGAVDRIKNKINTGRQDRMSQLKEFVNMKMIDAQIGTEGGVPIGKFGRKGKRTSLVIKSEEISGRSQAEEESSSVSSRRNKSQKRSIRDSSASRRKRPLLELLINDDDMPESYVDQYQAKGCQVFKGRRGEFKLGETQAEDGRVYVGEDQSGKEIKMFRGCRSGNWYQRSTDIDGKEVWIEEANLQEFLRRQKFDGEDKSGTSTGKNCAGFQERNSEVLSGNEEDAVRSGSAAGRGRARSKSPVVKTQHDHNLFRSASAAREETGKDVDRSRQKQDVTNNDIYNGEEELRKICDEGW